MWVGRLTTRCCKIACACALLATACLALGCERQADDAARRAAESGIGKAGKEAYAALKSENEALRRENQMLRRELVSKNGRLPDAVMPEKGSDAGFAVEPEVKDTGYWLSINSKVRHNKRCRNYRKVKGRPCGPNEGRPCKMCGG